MSFHDFKFRGKQIYLEYFRVSGSREINHMPSNHSHVYYNQISRHRLFKIQQMTGQNIKKKESTKRTLLEMY